MEVQYRTAETEKDLDALWELWQEVVGQKEYFPYDASYDRAYISSVWINREHCCVVAESAGKIVGGYILRPNQPGYGNHIANAAYMVAATHRGQGIGKAMGLHSVQMARSLGYLAMQFNLVVSTNESAVRAWIASGFRILCTIPDAFRHHKHGLVDAHIMYLKL
ncbi:MAG: GNAT family N-acetyltransferase [Saprospiraceae bacterium]